MFAQIFSNDNIDDGWKYSVIINYYNTGKKFFFFLWLACLKKKQKSIVCMYVGRWINVQIQFR